MYELTLEGLVRNPRTLDGAWCSSQARNAFKDAYIEAGYSEEGALKNAEKIIFYSIPEELTRGDMRRSGCVTYDKFYKKDGKYYQDTYYKDTFHLSFWSESWSKETKKIKDFNTDIVNPGQ